MPDIIHSFAWRFGGPLAGLPPELAWTVIAFAGMLGGGLILISYRRTLVGLAPSPRRALTALRLTLWLGLLLVLAGPTRIERTYAHVETRPLAVLVDHSGSMTTPDNRNQRRTDDALRRWRTFAPAAEAAHGRPRAFAFADTPAPANLAVADSPSALPHGETRLFTSLDHLLANAPSGGWGGIVTLTDGLDTATEDTAAALDATARAALASGTPLYLVPGRNRHTGGPLLALRDLTLPGQVPPRSTFRLEVTLDSYQPVDRVVPMLLRVGDTWREPDMLVLDAGRRLRTYGVEIAAESAGVLPIELRAGDTPDAPSLRAEVRVAAPVATRILYYQGELDWGYRFLADILRRDPAFSLTPIFNLAPAGTTLSARSVAANTPSLPDTAAGYAAYDVVILAQPRIGQLSADQQNALSAWVRSGGVVLFLAPDDDTTRGFTGSELEKMLPVVFAAPGSAEAMDPALASFREQIRRTNGGAHNAVERRFAEQAARNTRQIALSTFAWEPRALALLGPELAAAAPRFAHYARIHHAKPGADVLARHPRDQSAEGSERAVLLALQRYGRGQSAILASDALWRWKLNQPSTERGAELFWQNLLAWLGRENRQGPRFERAPLLVEKNRELLVRVSGADAGFAVTVRPDADTSSPETPSTVATPLFPAGEEDGVRLYRWVPPTDGRWMLTARGVGEDAPLVRHWLTVAALPIGENSGQPPDEARLRALAERTGGAVLTDTAPSAWLAAASGAGTPDLIRETTTPLWHQAWIFAALLALYATELLLRRRWKLL